VPHPDPTLLGALRLRRWVLSSWGTELPSPPEESEESWRLFLAREACAPRLKGRMHRSDVPPVLAAAADRDSQMVLALRVELHDVVALARRLGVAPIVLKGGAALHDPPRALFARDLDLLLPPEEAGQLLAAMAEAGWRSEGRGPSHHYADRARAGAPPIEIHPAGVGEEVQLGTDAVGRAIPHPALPGARLLAPADQVRHVACHQTVQHSSHRGRLRDLFLLADALTELGTAPAPLEWHLADGERAPVEATLAMADALARSTPVEDRFVEVAAIWYQLDAAATGDPLTTLQRFGGRWLFDIAAGGAAVRRRWRLMTADQLDTDHPYIVRMGRLLFVLPIFALGWFRLRRLRSGARAALDHLS
jgi:hypothetical protein